MLSSVCEGEFPTGVSLSTSPDAPISEEALAELRDLMGDDEGVADLLSDLHGDGLVMVPALVEAILAEDVTRLQQRAHALKGSSQTVGAAALGEILQTLEIAAKTGDLVTARRTLPALQHEWERLRLFLHDYLSRQ